ncbi:MFS transporter [Fodinicola acaciae]|uniref:MFS transporter n=1 Tax=Fodinicola acaciae TaxID=2681555 RepID=UPI0013D07E53|nr:MFS transporter [Fodinicola acaciae]
MSHRRRVSLGLFLCGLVTFGAVYTSQPLLPLLARDWRIGPGAASLAISATTAGLAVCVIPASLLAHRFGRGRTMAAAVLAGSVLTLAAAASGSFVMLVVLRTLAGVAYAGVAGVAMGYLAEQVPAGQLGAAAGLYIAGNSIGGMLGRVLTGIEADFLGWRLALAATGLLAVAGSVAAARVLPRASTQSESDCSGLGVRTALTDWTLLRLCLVGGLAIGGFVTAYNFLGFRLAADPFDLPQSVIGLIFLAYLAGTAGSASCGRLVDRLGHRRVLLATTAVSVVATIVTLPDALPLVLVGVVTLTGGFFATNSAATAAASQHGGLAGGLYNFAYYLGASVAGTAGGVIYGAGGWTATAWYVTALFVAAGAVGVTAKAPRHVAVTMPE